MSKQVTIILALAVVIAAGAGAYIVLQPHQGAPALPGSPAATMAVPAAPEATSAGPVVVDTKRDCWLPGPVPIPPNGTTATAADMDLGRTAAQDFVNQLQNFQACRNNELDHAPADATADQKKKWLDEGNAAVDEANAVANAFAEQLKAFKRQQAKH